VNRILSRLAALWIAIMLLASVCAFAENAISTTVVMRVSRMTQNAVVKAGEDLSIEVGIDGVEPQTYQWFFNDVPLDGANQKVYNIVNAQPEHTGVYRMDAFDANGKMLVSMDIAARVLEDTVPQAGDSSMPVGVALAAMALCGGALIVLLRRRAGA
jgi:LPXTG-motif cell wall-anchored protein